MYGSTRSVTDNHGIQESYYDYDIFGNPVAGDFTTGTDYGYLGKPYDSITGLYNYGYRDYSPQTVRFTTIDPIRDGSNWFAYVNNDPVNYIDLWGLFSAELQEAIDNHIGETYVLGVNDCDIWVEKVVKEANPNSTLDTDWGLAKETTAHGHKEKLAGKLTDSMEHHGDYIAIQESDNRGIHVMLVSYNEDGTVDLAHNTSNPENGVTPDGKGYSEQLPYKSKDHFDSAGWGKVSYYSLEEKKNK